jgi:hypothetical protein
LQRPSGHTGPSRQEARAAVLSLDPPDALIEQMI